MYLLNEVDIIPVKSNLVQELTTLTDQFVSYSGETIRHRILDPKSKYTGKIGTITFGTNVHNTLK